MLVLTRRNQESVVVGGSGNFPRVLKVTVLEIHGGKVKLGFEADDDIPVFRGEIWERMLANGDFHTRGPGPEMPPAEQ